VTKAQTKEQVNASLDDMITVLLCITLNIFFRLVKHLLCYYVVYHFAKLSELDTISRSSRCDNVRRT